MEDINETLYINNLNEKIKRNDLKKSLYALFARFGQILEIRAMKNNKMRGQAFIIFKDTNSSTKALNSMQNYWFFGKPMHISYSKKKSKIIQEMHGTLSSTEENLKKRENEKEDENEKLETIVKKQKTSNEEETTNGGEEKDGEEVDESLPKNAPNKKLYISRLPPGTTEFMIQMMFQQCAGFENANFIANEGVAIIEYKKIENATEALQKFQGFKISEGHFLRIDYSK